MTMFGGEVKRKFFWAALLLQFVLLAAALAYKKISNDTGPWQGEIFPNAQYKGTPRLVRARNLRFFFVDEPPASGYQKNFYSMIWRSCLTVREPVVDFVFRLYSDDGATLALDDLVIGDNDGPHVLQETKIDYWIRQGSHLVQVRFFQSIGQAHLILDAALGREGFKPIPQSLLSPPVLQDGRWLCPPSS